MSTSTTDDHNQPLSEINVTPMVDIMLVLLVIFILLAPMITNALQIDLPQAQAEPLLEPEVVELTVMPDGALLLDQQSVAQTELITQLNNLLLTQPELVVRLNANKDTHYQQLAEVLSKLQQAGIQRLAFAVQPN